MMCPASRTGASTIFAARLPLECRSLASAYRWSSWILGHVSGSRAGIVGIYQRHTYDAEKRAALDTWGDHVRSLVEEGDR